MPNKRVWIFREAKASLHSHNLQASATSMHRILRYQVNEWTDDEGKKSENHYAYQCNQWENWVHFMLNKCGYFNVALLTDNFARSHVKFLFLAYLFSLWVFSLSYTLIQGCFWFLDFIKTYILRFLIIIIWNTCLLIF